jgi:serine/threonine-protein kinase
MLEGAQTSLVGITLGGKYHLRRIIGSGGMGVVCEAHHTGLGKLLAVKLIDRSLAHHTEVTTRFRREARAASAVASEHIAQVYDVDIDPQRGLYLVMELLEGEDLAARIARTRVGRSDVETVVRIAQQVLRGLSKAHEARIIHRDLKPANVFLTKRDDGELCVKLLDFGVSKLLERGSFGEAWDDAITARGIPIGTPQYMSPEQAAGRLELDHRTDIWSLGAVLYEAFSGVPVFEEKPKFHETLLAIIEGERRPLLEVAPWVPPNVAAVVEAALVHDRDGRIPDCATFTRMLRDAFPSIGADGTLGRSAVIVMAGAHVDEEEDTQVIPNSVPLPQPPPTPAIRTDSPCALDPRDADRAVEPYRKPNRLAWAVAIAATIGTAFIAGRASVHVEERGPAQATAPPRVESPPPAPTTTSTATATESAAASSAPKADAGAP